MSCAYRSHRYRSSVTACPVSWKYPTGHAQHPISLRPLVVHPHRQVVTETANDAPIPVSLVQYLWSRWQESPPDVRDAVTAVIGELMRSPRWHWDVTVLPDQSPPDPQRSCVSERTGRPTIGIPSAMLRELWRWVLDHIDERAAVLRWWAIDPALWQALHTHQRAHGRRLTEQDWYRLHGYLSPVLLPDIAHTTRHLLTSADPNDQQMALTVLERWMASDDHATRDLAAQMLRAWLNEQAAASTTHDQLRLRALTILASYDNPAVVSARLYDFLCTVWNRIEWDDVRTAIDLLHGRGDGRSLATDRWMSLIGKMVRDHPSDVVISEVLYRLIPAIRSSVRPDDRVRWVTTLWNLMTDSTRSDTRRQTIATALKQMMQDPMVAARVHAQLCTEPSRLQTLPTPICDTLLEGLLQTAHADTVLRIIAQEIRQNPNAITRFDRIVAAGWGNGHDQRILQMIDQFRSPHWRTVLTQGITTSVGAEVCARIAQIHRDSATTMVAIQLQIGEYSGNLPLAPLPAHLIRWVCDAAHRCPYYLHPTTIRRLWLTDPVRAWDVTQTMLDSDNPSVQQHAIAAVDAGWGRGHDGTLTATLREFILHARNPAVVETGVATAVAGIGRADPSLIESLLTHLATSGNTDVQRQLIQALHRGWGRGQDDLVVRVLAIIADRTSSDRVWDNDTLIRLWDYLPPHVMVSLVDRLVTHATSRLVKDGLYSPLGPSSVEQFIAAFAPGWDHLPTAHIIEHIAHHVAYLCAHADDPTISHYGRETLISAWARVIAASAERLSASDIHALLFPPSGFSPRTGVSTGLRGGFVDEVRRRGFS